MGIGRLLDWIEDGEMDERSIYFHLERLIGKDLFVVAVSREAVYSALTQISIPQPLWESMCGFMGGTPGSEETLRNIANRIFGEVFVHTVLDLPRTKDWEALAIDKVSPLDRQSIKSTFWKNVRGKRLSVNDATKSLAHIGISDSDLKEIFES